MLLAIPPTIGAAIRFITLAPVPFDHMIGSNPAMIAVWILGPLLAWLTGAYLDTWMQIKFVLVIAMSGMHGLFVRCWRDFANDRNTRSARFYRIANEMPALLLVLIVILVKVQPFGD